MRSQTIQVGPQAINVYQSEGDGPAALLIHGNSCSGLTFRHQFESPLGEKYRLVALDLPGHGDSARAVDPQSTYTLPGYAAIIAGAAEQLGLMDAVIAGWSLGGNVVLEATSRFPNAPGFLIFGAPPVGEPATMAQAFLPNPAMASAFKAELSEEEIQAIVAAFLKPGARHLPEQFIRDVQRTDGIARQILGGSIHPGGYADEVAIVGQLSTPLAILHGAQEQLANLAYINSVTMPTLWRGAVQIIADAGHAAHWEEPKQFNALLEAFLAETAR